MKAADTWITYNYDERSKFAIDLLLTVRLNLLPNRTLRKVLRKSNYKYSFVFQRNKECVDLASVILRDKNKFFDDCRFLGNETRYCSQNEFNILICGGIDARDNYKYNVVKSDVENLQKVEILTNLFKNPKCFWTLNIKHELYLLNFSNYNHVDVHKYCLITKFWENVTVIRSERYDTSCSVYMDKIYIIGGRDETDQPTQSCIELNTSKCKYKHIKRLNQARVLASSTVYEEKIVASGGYTDDNNLSTVEAYDHAANTWTYMSSMNYGRCYHALVAIKNKLFVFGGETEVFEMYDSFTKTFAILKPPPSVMNTGYKVVEAIPVGKKILIFKRYSTTITIFDLDKNEWSEERFNATKEIDDFCCFKVPKI